jgi:pectin methylesterase-like acyl-CoA thioesterase
MKPKYFLFLFLTLTILHQTSSIATVRYVSKTGTSTPPYTSWATAADSIQKAVNIADVGDTIYVANGIYNESIYVDKTINLWGSSMDSTVINGSQVDYI